MERLRKTGLAFVIIGAGFLGMVSAQSAPTGVAGSGPEPVAAEALADWAHRLCAVIEEERNCWPSIIWRRPMDKRGRRCWSR